MEKRSSSWLSSGYRPPDLKNWSGRSTQKKSGAQYWYQVINPINLPERSIKQHKNKKKSVALLGYACEEGVIRNQGRVGAAEGPAAIRKRLAKLPIHFKNKQLFDAGDLLCVNRQMEKTQKQLRNSVYFLLQKDIFPIILGGGHDVALGTFKGIFQKINQGPQKKIGIINFDAHFDLRPLAETGNSGTPFFQIAQILKKHNQPFRYLVAGIQPQGNTQALFNWADKHQVAYILSDKVVSSRIKKLKKKLQNFMGQVDHLYLSIDMDGFSSAFAPGVSAPSPLGFEPKVVFKLLKWILNSKKVRACDIAELNPSYDQDEQTARLAATLIDFIVDRI